MPRLTLACVVCLAAVDAFRVAPQQRSSPRAKAAPRRSLRVDAAPKQYDRLGATMLVASNMIGGGVLALPTVTAEAGFGVSTGLLCALWAANLFTGVCLGDVAAAAVRRGERDVSLRTLSRNVLGAAGSTLVSMCYVLTNVLLLAAYVSQGGDALASAGILLPEGAPFEEARLAYAGLTLVLVAGPGRESWFASKLDTALVALMGLSFAALATVAMPYVSPNLLLDSFHPDPFPAAELAEAAPVLASALVYQNIVPTIAKRCDGDEMLTRTTVALGTLLPLVLYVLFNAVTLGHIDPTMPLAKGPGGLVDATLGLPPDVSLVARSALNVFSLAAVTGSAIGASISQVEELKPLFGRRYAALACAAPPLALALASRDVFIPALEFTGSYFNPALFGALPIALLLRHHLDLFNAAEADDRTIPEPILRIVANSPRMTPLVASSRANDAKLASATNKKYKTSRSSKKKSGFRFDL